MFNGKGGGVQKILLPFSQFNIILTYDIQHKVIKSRKLYFAFFLMNHNNFMMILLLCNVLFHLPKAGKTDVYSLQVASITYICPKLHQLKTPMHHPPFLSSYVCQHNKNS